MSPHHQKVYLKVAIAWKMEKRGRGEIVSDLVSFPFIHQISPLAYSLLTVAAILAGRLSESVLEVTGKGAKEERPL